VVSYDIFKLNQQFIGVSAKK